MNKYACNNLEMNKYHILCFVKCCFIRCYEGYKINII